MAKFAPANAEGEKPYVVTVWAMGRESDRLVYAVDAPAARFRAAGRRRATEYAVSVRRALADEVVSDG